MRKVKYNKGIHKLYTVLTINKSPTFLEPVCKVVFLVHLCLMLIFSQLFIHSLQAEWKINASTITCFEVGVVCGRVANGNCTTTELIITHIQLWTHATIKHENYLQCIEILKQLTNDYDQNNLHCKITLIPLT